MHREFLSETSWCVSLTPAPGQDIEGFRRGDVDSSGEVSALPDALFLLSYGFLEGDEPGCADAADVDDSGGVSPLPDAIFLLRWGFGEGEPIPSPGASCGADPTDDDLDCGAASCD